jgi:ribonucleoside-diphosphate reductase alpha chain
MATIHKTGGGTGFSFSHLRPDRDMVGTTKGVASGPVSFMRIYDVATEVIKQGGRRRGANMGILNVSHPDILSFISSKVNGGFSNFNLSVSADDNFMKSVDNEYEYKLINPRNNEIISQVNSKELFDRICYLAWQTGDPGMIFLDEINRHNPTPELGMIEATNPCGEVPLLPFESCNLGSINLSEFVDKRDINWERLSDIIGLGVNFLDNVIDANRYPLKEIETIAKGNRKIGLGVMGFAEMLIRMRIPYNSEEAVDTAGRVMQFVNKKAEDASRELAKVKGSFPNIDKSIYKGGEMRNATRTSIAPTGSISTIAGTTSGIEPLFAIAYIREVLEGERLVEINPMFVGETKRMNLYSTDLIRRVEREGNLKNVKLPSDLKKLFVTSLEVEPEYHIKIQAAFQRYTDNAVSKTVNLPNSATVEDVKKIYKLAYKMKCKGITIFRQGSRQRQVLYEGGITERDLHACQRENCYL